MEYNEKLTSRREREGLHIRKRVGTASTSLILPSKGTDSDHIVMVRGKERMLRFGSLHYRSGEFFKGLVVLSSFGTSWVIENCGNSFSL